MIPIEKNITVVDEQGNYYEATYPKRAKGLVKNGRARFIDENTICLACPPCDMEDNNMSNNTENKVLENQQTEKFSMNYVLEQLERIATQTDYLNSAISELSKITSKGPGDIGASAKSQALGEIVTSRERTNQKLIALYEKMYNDLKPNSKKVMAEMLVDQLGNATTPNAVKDAIVDILGTTLQDSENNLK